MTPLDVLNGMRLSVSEEPITPNTQTHSLELQPSRQARRNQMRQQWKNIRREVNEDLFGKNRKLTSQEKAIAKMREKGHVNAYSG